MSTTDDERQILALLEARGAAMARGDAQGAVAPLAPDVVVYDLPPPLEYRGDAARSVEGLEEWFATWENGVSGAMREPKVLVGGDLAVVHGLVNLRGTKRGEGQVDSWFRDTVVLARRDGAWVIVHEHSSFPMMMDGSNRVANDLTPD